MYINFIYSVYRSGYRVMQPDLRQQPHRHPMYILCTLRPFSFGFDANCISLYSYSAQ